MRSDRTSAGGRFRVVVIAGATASVLVLAACSAMPVARPSNTVVISSGGFGDPSNSYTWSMATFNGKLYVGTARNEGCVEKATAASELRGFYGADPAAHCPADPYDMDLRAEIWSYDPATAAWTRVYRSTQVPNPRAPGKMIARDIGYRGMVVVGNRLYVGAVSADEWIPDLYGSYPPELLSTADGTTWQAADLTLPDANPAATTPAPFGTIQTPAGFSRPMGIRAMANLNGQLYVTASLELIGEGAVLAVTDPSSPTPTFTQVSPPTMTAFELEPFDGQLYVGTADTATGYGVSRLDPSGQWVTVLAGGAGRGKNMTSVVSMKAYGGRLYVGASGWFEAQGFPSELISVAADGSWVLVAGNARTLPGGQTVTPTSGFGDGFGNGTNAHFWRMVVLDGALYVGTNDWSYTLASVPLLGDLDWHEFGFDIFATCDGTNWWAMTHTAFGTSGNNFGARGMEALGGHLYVGSTNQLDGTTIYRNDDPSPCTPSAPLAGPTGARLASAAPLGAPAT